MERDAYIEYPTDILSRSHGHSGPGRGLGFHTALEEAGGGVTREKIPCSE